MKKIIAISSVVLFVFLMVQSLLIAKTEAGDTWDNIKKKTRITKQQTKLKMKRSDYEDKIKETYTKLGEQIYKDEELKEKVKSDERCAELIRRAEIFFKKIEKIEEKLAVLDEGEEVSNEEIENIDEGVGLFDEEEGEANTSDDLDDSGDASKRENDTEASESAEPEGTSDSDEESDSDGYGD